MTNSIEWSTEFDILFNNITSNQAPGLNEYEKSVALTQALEEMVITIYSGRRLHPFESTEEVTRYLAPLVKQVTIVVPKGVSSDVKLGSNSYFYALPADLWFKTLERAVISDDSLKCDGDKKREVAVIPVTQDEYDRTVNNPFKGQGKRRVLSLTPEEGTTELVSNYKIAKYIVRYIRRPKPIILADLSSTGLSINGQTAESPCELHEALHRTILARAVEIARSEWMNTVQAQR